MEESFALAVPQWQRLYAQGRLDDCRQLAASLLQRHPDSPKAQHLYGMSLLLGGELAAACDMLRRAADVAPGDAAIWDGLGIALQRSGELDAAETAFRQSLTLAPAAISVLINASTNARLNGNADEALRRAERAAALAPHVAMAHTARGNALAAAARHPEAIAAFEQALSLRSAPAEALLGLGSSRQALGDFGSAQHAFTQALQIAPNYPEALINLGWLHGRRGDTAQAAACYERARTLQPDSVQAWSGWLFHLLHSESEVGEIVARHFEFGRHFDGEHHPPHDNRRDPERRLRVGFVSADLRDHPVARCIAPVWRAFDRRELEVVVYASNAGDRITDNLRPLADEWHDVAHLSHRRLHELIAAHAIDVLVDLSGHTAGTRLAVFALKPAPIQVSWMGYPATTGLRSIDYYWSDAIKTPPGRLDHQFSERLEILPCASLFERPEALPDINPLPALARGHLTFGSFNRPVKLDDATLALWAQLLRALPTAQLLLAGVPDDDSGDRLRARLQHFGALPHQLRTAPQCPLADYLQLHGDVDIALDPLAFSGGTTTDCALWMGIPTLTVAGNALWRRHCASRLHDAGLDDFIAADGPSLIAKGLDWSARPGELAALRTSLRARMETQAVRQPALVARGIERSLRDMWRTWCAST